MNSLFATATPAQLSRLTRVAFATARREHPKDDHAAAAKASLYVVEVLDARDAARRAKYAAAMMQD